MYPCVVSVSQYLLSPHSYAVMIVCWNHDPQERAKFVSLTQQLSNILEQEAGYLDLRRSLSWRAHQKPQKIASGAKAPALQSIGEGVMEESVEMEELETNAAKRMELREDEVNERDCEEDCAV